MSKEQALTAFKSFPYLFCVKPDKVSHTLEFLKEKDFSKEDTLRVLSRAGGILASPKSALPGIYLQFQQLCGFNDEDVTWLLKHQPEFLLMGRYALLAKKFILLKRNSEHTDMYMKHLMIRHPDIFMGSVNSFQNKIKLKYELKLRFKDEQAFPLFFKMNYYEEIRP